MSEKKYKIGDKIHVNAQGILPEGSSGFTPNKVYKLHGICDSNAWKYGVLNDYGKLTYLLEGQISPYTEPATPTAQWQKEAEEIVNVRYKFSEWDEHYHVSIKAKREGYTKGFIEASTLRHAEKLQELSAKEAEHTAYKEQVQREVDEIYNHHAKKLQAIKDNRYELLQGSYTDSELAHYNELIQLLASVLSDMNRRLRSITQTKTDKG